MINECNTVDTSLSRSIADKNKTIEEYEEVLATFETNKKQKIADEEKELTSLEAELATLNKNMATAKEELEKLPKNENLDRSDYNTAKKELEDINNRLGELKKEKFEHESEIANSVKNIAKLTTELGNVNDTCYACKQPLKEEDVENVKSKLRDDIKKEEDAKSVLEFAVPKIDKNIETVTKSQKEKEEEVEKLRQKYASIDLDAEKVRNKESEIASIQRQIEYQEKQIASQKNRLNSAKEEAKPNLNVPKLKKVVGRRKDDGFY